MKHIGYYIFLIFFLIIFIPVVVLGGVGEGLKLPVIINRIPSFLNQPEDVKKVDSDIKVKVYDVKKGKIIELNLEDYVAGVVSAEMPVSFHIEALKAQAIAARTFVLANMISQGGSGCSKCKGADVCSDVHCQAWLSKEERLKLWAPEVALSNWNKIMEAVNSTKGLVITYNGQIAKHVKYHSTSGGKTEDSRYVFGYQEPYLVSVESPYEEEAPNYITTVVMTKQEFVRRIKQLSPSIKIDEKKLANQIKILDWTEGGRVNKIKIGDQEFTGIDIRWAMGLKSAAFSIKIDSKNVTFTVKGYGHGVGMSQWGANEMGKRGYTYNQIIKHYFKGVEIKNIDEVLKN
ncbi:stage II sporulation protein D [Caloramator fervidus]|uniref:Stage II sporulation protein D n=1 Tax=Caloramator fervidus TaxID=29344 RepID=A0A1H5RLL2_9CLOT|nr:stage II sporulation protein D [Caloramator fervidus]SEF39160.1 stage II sporulation protein D [Caloramator fervidus]